MAKKNGKKLYTVDHANKLADRERANPNRRILRMLRAGERVPGNLAGRARKVAEEPE